MKTTTIAELCNKAQANYSEAEKNFEIVKKTTFRFIHRRIAQDQIRAFRSSIQ